VAVGKRLSKREQELQHQNEELRLRLEEADETLRAIREGEVDAVIVTGSKGEQVFSLVGTDSIYRLIVETMKEAAFTITIDGTILFCNAQFSQFVNRPLENIVGHAVQEFIAESNHPAAISVLHAAQGHPVRQRLVFKTADGVDVPAHISANILNQPDGLSICIVASDLRELENSTELIRQLRAQQEALRLANDNLCASQIELEDARGKYRELFETAPDGYIVTDSSGDIQEANQAALALFNRSINDLKGKSFSVLLTSRSVEEFIRRLADLNTGESTPSRWEMEIPSEAGGYIWTSITVASLRDEENHINRLLWLIRDISRRKQAEEIIKASLVEKELMLKEIHHRVKNNLQIISSLVSLQVDGLPDERLHEALNDIRDRVRTIALVHEKLYQTADLARLNFSDYTSSLMSYMWRVYGAAAKNIRLILDIKPVFLPIDAALHCGLILNELASNALKHAFPQSAEGEVTVSAVNDQKSGTLVIRVCDNGIGLPPDLDFRQARSLGLRLVQMLVEQMYGSIQTGSGPGSEFIITLNLKDMR
jgi:PAS domain S-box-containing protein